MWRDFCSVFIFLFPMGVLEKIFFYLGFFNQEENILVERVGHVLKYLLMHYWVEQYTLKKKEIRDLNNRHFFLFTRILFRKHSSWSLSHWQSCSVWCNRLYSAVNLSIGDASQSSAKNLYITLLLFLLILFYLQNLMDMD